MIAELALLLLLPSGGEQGGTQQPRERFLICPGHPRCPRNAEAGPSDSVGAPGGAANYGSLSLRSGFAPDPYVVRIRSGGSVDASTLHSGCNGFVAPAPDLRVQYSAGSLPLIFTATGTDVSLLINGPDGRWHCAPLSEAGVTYRFDRPSSGQYDVWVGASRNGGSRIEVQISEMGAAAPDSAD